MRESPKLSRATVYAGMGMALGAALGLLFGMMLLESVFIGPIVGAVVGAMVGMIWELGSKREQTKRMAEKKENAQR